MSIIDTHLHLDNKFKKASEAIKNLDKNMKNANINNGVLLHVAWQDWSIKEIANNLDLKKIKLFYNPDTNSIKEIKKIPSIVNELNISGIKIHPRFQNFNFFSKKTKYLLDICSEISIPILVCAFFDGITVKKNITPYCFANLAKINKNTNLIFAHFGGYHYMDFMMMAKYFENVYLDLSFTPYYFRESNIPENLIYACKSLKFDKIFYGSDFPEVSHNKSILGLSSQFKKYKVSNSDQSKIFFKNAQKFFKF